MSAPPDWKTLDRYLAGEVSPAEESRIRAWLDQDASRKALLDALRAGVAQSGSEVWDADDGWRRLTPRLERAAVLPFDDAGRRASAVRRRAWLAAATALITTGAVSAWWGMNRTTSPATVALRELTTPNGARTTVTLQDGSRVTLNAGSTLRHPADFGRGARDVYLEGEAYFEVTHDAAHPFRVHARGGVASDLGTRFTVRAYPELPRVEVVVAEGLVSLRRDQATPGDSAVVGPGQLGTLGDSGAPAVESNVDVDRWMGWTRGALVFEAMTLGEALPQLERWYDVDITVTNPALASRRITAHFRDENVTEVLDALAITLGARYQRAGRTITLSSPE